MDVDHYRITFIEIQFLFFEDKCTFISSFFDRIVGHFVDELVLKT